MNISGRHRKGTWLIGSAAVALLTACGSTHSDPTPPVSPSGMPATATLPSGPAVEHVGISFTVSDGTGVPQATVTITKIDTAPHCTASSDDGGNPPQHGHYIIVWMDVATAPSMGTQWGYPTSYDFALTGPDGYTETSLNAVGADMSDCLSSDQGFGQPETAATKYRGGVLLDTKDISGTLIYRPHWYTTTPGFKIAIGS